MTLAVLIPAYNAATYIVEAVHSVLHQEGQVDTQIIIANDGSTDKTAVVLDELAKQHPQVLVVAHENRGVSATRNRLMSLIPTDCDFVTFLDADDALAQGRVDRDLSLLTRNPDIDLIYGRLQLVQQSVERLWSVPLYEGICLRGVSVTTATFRTSALHAIGDFDVRMTHGEDLDFLLRFFETSDRFTLLDEVSVLYRRNAGNTATSDAAALQSGVMRALLQHAKRRRKDPTLRRVDGIFEMDRLISAYENEGPTSQ